MNLSQWLPAIRYFVSVVGQTWYLAGQPDLDLTSWFRGAAENKAVGGLPNSLHLVGLAIDVTGQQQALAAFASSARRIGLTVVTERSHLHLQLWPRGVGPRP